MPSAVKEHNLDYLLLAVLIHNVVQYLGDVVLVLQPIWRHVHHLNHTELCNNFELLYRFGFLWLRLQWRGNEQRG